MGTVLVHNVVFLYLARLPASQISSSLFRNCRWKRLPCLVAKAQRGQHLKTHQVQFVSSSRPHHLNKIDQQWHSFWCIQANSKTKLYQKKIKLKTSGTYFRIFVLYGKIIHIFLHAILAIFAEPKEILTKSMVCGWKFWTFYQKFFDFLTSRKAFWAKFSMGKVV